MTDKYKKQIAEFNRRIYSGKTLQQLKNIGKRKGLLNVDQYNKRDKNVLIERLVKGRQISDESKDFLIQKAKNMHLSVNATMSKQDILEKISSKKLIDHDKEYLIRLAKERGVNLPVNTTKEEIFNRLNNPSKNFTKQSLTEVAKANNIQVPKNISKPNLINLLVDRNLITTTPITTKESNLGVHFSNVPYELIRTVTKKSRTVEEALEDYKKYIASLKSGFITSKRLKQLTKVLEKKEREVEEKRKKVLRIEVKTSAFKSFNKVYDIDGKGRTDVIEFLIDAGELLIPVLMVDVPTKVKLVLYLIMKKDVLGFDLIRETPFRFSSHIELNLQATDKQELYYDMCNAIEEQIQKNSESEGSGWTTLKIKNLELHTAGYHPLSGSLYIELSNYLKNKKAIINMKNNDDKCFLWCVLRKLNPTKIHPERVDKDLKSKVNTVNMGDIKYPVRLEDINKFESLNPDIAIKVFSYEDDTKNICPIRLSKHKERSHIVKLLLIEK